MSQIFDFTGKEDFFHVGPKYSSRKKAGLFLPVGKDVYFPRKRARVNAPKFVNDVNLKQKSQVSLDNLPDECLFEILRRLPEDKTRSACASVSKRWLMLLSNIPKANDVEVEGDGFLTRNLEGKKATDVRLAALAVGIGARGGLGKLAIRGGRGVTDLGLRAVARCCPSLKSLSLWDAPSVGDEGLVEIATRCPRLEKLDLYQCPGVTDKALLAIAKHCPNLTTINLEGCQTVGNEGLQAIGQLCLNLKSIVIEDCPLVGDQGIVGLLSSISYSLTKLRLKGLNITDVSLAVVGHYGKALTELVLLNLQNVNERGFWVMGNADGLQHLKSINISSCRVTDAAIDALGKGCPNLKHFILKKCAFLSDNGLVSFIKASRSLETLQIEECHRITQIGFFGLLLTCGPQLKALTMSSCYGFKEMIIGVPLSDVSSSLRSLTVRDCPGLGDMTLSMLAKLCPQLQFIDFSGVHGISDAGLLSLINSCEAGAGLIKVGLVGCINITDNVVVALTKTHGGTLRVLNLEGCGKVTDVSLVAIANDCLLLNELDVSKCGITDFGVSTLASSKQLSLLILSLSGCSMLSDKCLPFLVKMGKSLMGLNLQNCNSISTCVVDMLVERLFQCDIVS